MKHSLRWSFVLVVIIGLLVGSWWIIHKEAKPRSQKAPALPAIATVQAGQPAATQNPVATTSPSQITTARPPATISPLSACVLEKLNEERREKKRYDQPAEAAKYYRLKRLPEGEKEIPVEKYFTAKAQMEAMPQYSTAQNRSWPSRNEMRANRTEAITEALGTWTPLGPGNIGGRTRVLLIHPTNPNVMYAAGVSGGIWKTEDSGGHWRPLTDFLASLAVCALAIDPKNPSVLYAGTGEGYFNIGSIRGAGIFKSNDGGVTWQQLASTNTQDFYYVNDLVVSPTDSERLYAATDTGIWRSLNAGATWSRVLDPDVNGGCLDLVVRTDQATDYVFAACGTFEQAAVYRNANAAGGGSWEKVLSETNMGRTSLALAPSNQAVIYAAAAWTNGGKGSEEGRLRAVWRSSSSGDMGSWTVQVSGTDAARPGSLLLSNPIAASMTDCGYDYDNELIHQGWFDNAIAVDPRDENRVWIGGVDLFRSDDGGRTWGLASYWWAEKNVPSYAHADHHAIAFHPGYNGTTNKQMFVGTDGGIFRTDDARAAVGTGALAACNPGNTQVKWVSLNQGLAVTQFYHGLPFPNGQSFFGGTQDNGTVLGTETSGANNWREIHGGDGGYVAIDPANPKVLFATNPGGYLVKSTDGGATFSSAMFGLQDYGALFVAPVVMDPSDSQRLWLGGSKLWRTNRGAANWSAASAGPGNVSALAVAPTDSNTVLAGTASGGIVRSDTALLTDANTQWRGVAVRQGFVSGLAFDPTNAKIAYAVYSTFGGAHVWRTMDGGATWNSIDGFGGTALPDVPVNCIAVDPANPARLFAGTDLGMFVTTDGGGSWQVENSGFANVAVSALAVQSSNGVTSLYAFTYGRGAWRVTLGASGCSASLSATERTFGATGGSGTISVQGGCSWDAAVNETGAGWITLSRDGNTVTYTIAPNQTLKKRTSSLTIAGRSFVVFQEAFQDVTPPTLAITSPVASGIYTTDTDQIVISGTASDNVALTSLNVESDREVQPFGNTGTMTNWNLTGLRLLPGINTFTVTVWDSSSNKTSAQLTVHYKPQYTRLVVAGGVNPNQQGDGVPATATGISPKDVAVDQDGNFYLGGQYGGRVRKVTAATGLISTIAGGGQSYEDGKATDAALHSPDFVAVDRNGNVYLAEPVIHIVRKVTPTGQIQTVVGSVGNYRNSIGGYGGDGGPATQARLNSPQGIAVDHLGNLYIADQGNYRVRRVSPDGVITTFAGSGLSGSTGDGGPATAARMYPYDVAVDNAGNVYILESSRVRKVDVTTGTITTVAGGGASSADNLPATQTKYELLKGLAVGGDGSLYLADYRTNKVFRVGTDGISRAIAVVPGTPVSLDVDRSGNIYVVEQSTFLVRKLVSFVNDAIPPTIKITGPSVTGSYIGTVNYLNIQGTVSDNLEFTHATWSNDRGGGGRMEVGRILGRPDFWQQMNIPLKPGLNVVTVTAWDVAGNRSSDVLNVNFVIGTPFSTVAGTRTSGYSGDNAIGTAAQLWSPETLVVDNDGNIFVAERGNHTIRKITPAGIITAFAGNGQVGASGDGGPATAAMLNEPSGLALDAAGNVYIADTNNHRIRKVAPDGVIRNFAGTGVAGFSGDGGAATSAQLATPVGLAFDAAGNLYVADADNNRVRKISPTGVITTIAGGKISPTAAEGIPATEYPLKFPTALAFAPTGELYLADTGKHSIRKIDANGKITTAVPGDGNWSSLNAPGNLAFDRKGVLYIADQKNNRVQTHVPGYNAAGLFAGGRSGNMLDSGAREELILTEPAGVAFDRNGNLFIADTGNHRIVKLEFKNTVTTVSGASYAVQAVAAGSIVSAFGSDLATITKNADTLPLPQDIGGTSVRIRDVKGIDRLAPLFYVSPLQVNYQIPEGTAPGYVSVNIVNNGRAAPTEYLLVKPLSPGLFAANQNGRGAAAASWLLVSGTKRRSEQNAVCDANGQNCTARAIDLNSADEVYLELYGTGIRNNSGLSNVTVTVGGVSVPVLYASKQPEYAGLDQVNIQLPRSLAGRGEVDVIVTIDGQAANPVKVNLK